MSSVFKSPVLPKSTKGEEGGALDVFPILKCQEKHFHLLYKVYLLAYVY